MTLVGFCGDVLINDVRVAVSNIWGAPYWFNKVRGITSVNQTMLKLQTHIFTLNSLMKRKVVIFSLKSTFFLLLNLILKIDRTDLP